MTYDLVLITIFFLQNNLSYLALKVICACLKDHKHVIAWFPNVGNEHNIISIIRNNNSFQKKTFQLNICIFFLSNQTFLKYAILYSVIIGIFFYIKKENKYNITQLTRLFDIICTIYNILYAFKM